MCITGKKNGSGPFKQLKKKQKWWGKNVCDISTWQLKTRDESFCGRIKDKVWTSAHWAVVTSEDLFAQRATITKRWVGTVLLDLQERRAGISLKIYTSRKQTFLTIWILSSISFKCNASWKYNALFVQIHFIGGHHIKASHHCIIPNAYNIIYHGYHSGTLM